MTIGRRWPLMFAAIVGFLSILAFSTNASAYAPRLSLVTSDPPSESSAAHLPRSLELQFSDTLIEAQVTLMDPAGEAVALGVLTMRDETARVPVSAADGVPGRYTVSYSTTSTGGRASNGSFSFTVSTGGKASPTKAGGKSPSVNPTASPATSAAGTAAAVPVGETSGNPPMNTGALVPEPRSDPPAWWTFAAVLLVIACVLVAFLGFSRRRIRPPNVPSQPAADVPTQPTANEGQ